jgi:hypothetical protein
LTASGDVCLLVVVSTGLALSKRSHTNGRRMSTFTLAGGGQVSTAQRDADAGECGLVGEDQVQRLVPRLELGLERLERHRPGLNRRSAHGDSFPGGSPPAGPGSADGVVDLEAGPAEGGCDRRVVDSTRPAGRPAADHPRRSWSSSGSWRSGSPSVFQ